MVLTILAGLLGAFLGVSLPSRLWAVAAAVGISGFTHAMLVLMALGWIGSGGDLEMTLMTLAAAGAEPADLGMTIGTAGLSAVFAGMLTRRGQGDPHRDLQRRGYNRAAAVGPTGQRTDALIMR